MNKLNLGCGPDVREGWENVDRDPYEGAIQCDFLATPLPFDDNHFDIVVANHTIQMIRYVDLPKAMAEIHRVLKPSGTVRILVPDLLAAISAFERNEPTWFPIVNEAETSIGGKLCAYITWYSEANLVFTPSWLAEIVQRSGFQASILAVGGTASGIDEILELDSRPRESIVVEGRKL